MKKSKKILILAATAVGLLSLAGCNEVTANGNVILSFKDANGTLTNYTADELFEEYTANSQDSTQNYYNAIYNVMVREWFTLSQNESLKKECDKTAQIKLDSQKSQASTNATSNGTSYDTEWEKILNSELSDVAESKRSEAELLLKYQLSEYKTKLEDEYYNQFKTWKKDDASITAEEKTNNLFWGDSGYLKKKLPYHVKHILINVDATSGAYYNGTISSTNVQNLYLAISELANGTSFGQIAEDLSNDTGSAATFGDLGIMDTSTSYVNEFKLGVYAYDTYFNTNSEVTTSLTSDDNPFNIPTSDASYVKSLGIASIPYGAITKMNELKDTTLDSTNKVVNDGDATYYPRNILFNKYFNNHNLGFITPDDLSGSNPTLEDSSDSLNAHYTDLNTNGKWTNGSQNTDYSAMKGFRDVQIKNYDDNGVYTGIVTKKILCDDNGNPIIVVRAGTSNYQGVHFIVVQRSALEANKSVTSNGETYNVPLNEYYASENPLTNGGAKNTDFPTTSTGTQKQTFVNSYSMSYDKYNERVSTIKTTVKSFDSNYEMRIFNWLEGQLSVTFNTISGVNVGDRITNYINEKRNSTDNDTRTTNIQTWDNFIEQIEVQQSQRKTKLIPETCALHFKEGFKDNADKTVVEACYYVK
jgi:hypothetical protein